MKNLFWTALGVGLINLIFKPFKPRTLPAKFQTQKCLKCESGNGQIKQYDGDSGRSSYECIECGDIWVTSKIPRGYTL